MVPDTKPQSSPSSEMPKIDLDFSQPQFATNHPKKSTLLILLIIAATFLLISLAASGVYLFLKTQPKQALTAIAQINPQDISTVKSVQWVAPDMPSAFKLRQENTDGVAKNIYSADGNDCTITTVVQPFTDNTIQPSEKIVADAKEVADVSGQKDGATIIIKDVDTMHEYDFASAEFSQQINPPGLDFGKLQSVVVFKKFNYELAYINFGCKSSVWDSKKAELEELIKKFMIKTERIT